MKNYFVLIFLFISFFSSSQNTNQYQIIDDKIDVIPENLENSTTSIAKFIDDTFTSNDDKIRAAFYWTASNISYDIENMFNQKPLTPEEKIASALQSKKGVCMHYAEIFSDIMNKLGNKTILVDGYTKQNGKVDQLSHVWCATKISDKWYLFDPTWASGNVKNGIFYKKINNTFYKALPENLISSHMPFDYLWQFSDYPITNQEFYDGKTALDKKRNYFDYYTTISKIEKQTENDVLFESLQRIEKNGLINNLIIDRFNNKKQEVEVKRQNSNVTKLNELITEFNEGIAQLNDFIYYRNHQFKPTLPDEEIKKMITNSYEKLSKCKTNIYAIGNVGKENATNVGNLKKAILEAFDQAEIQQKFVTEYLTKGNGERKKMFKKVSWTGVLN